MVTRYVEGPDGDHRLLFWCHGCDQPHQVRVAGKAGVWSWNGDRMKPTLSPSIKVTDGQGRICHSFLKDGQLEFLPDSTHRLAGETVPLTHWDW